jgi:hypothetical protein
MEATTAGQTVAISSTTAVSRILYVGLGGGWTQSASTVINGYSQSSIDIQNGTVTFSGAIVTNQLSLSTGTLVTGAFTHSIRNSNSTIQAFNASNGTLNLTNTTLNIGTTLASGDSASQNIFSVSSGVTLTTTGSTINLGSTTSGSFPNNAFTGGVKTYNIVNINDNFALSNQGKLIADYIIQDFFMA